MAESGRIAFTITIDNQGKPVISDVTKQIQTLEQTATGATSKMSNGFAATWKQMALGAGAAIAVTAFMKDSVRAFMESEAIQADMIQTMTGLGIATDANIAKFTGLADEILRTTTIDDEAAKSMISLGLTMGVTSDRIEEAVKGAIGLGKAFGLDAQAAMKGVSAAMQGNFALLGRYIPALQEAKTEQEKWALVQKAMTGGFQREQESINTSLGMWKQFQNQIGEVKESVGGFLIAVVKWLYDAREAIAAAALAMGMLFVVGHISAWSTAISGALSSMIAQLATANTAALTLKLTMGQIALVGAAAFVGWEIGRLIGEITGLDEVVQDGYTALLDFTGLNAKSTAVLSEYTIAHAAAAQKTLATNRALRESVPAIQESAKSLSTFALMLGMINPALASVGKMIDLTFSDNRMQDRIIAHAEAVKKAQEAYESFGKSLGFLSNTAMKGVDTQTKSLIKSVQEYGPQLNATGTIQKKVWEEAIRLMQAYVQAGKPVPQGLQDIIDKYKSMITLQNTMRDIKVELPDGKVISDSWVDPLARVDKELNNFFSDMDAGRPVLDEFGNQIKVTSKETEKWYKDAQDLAAGLQALNGVFNQLIPGLGDVIGGFMGAYESMMKLADAQSKGTASFGQYLGTIGAVIGALSAIGNAYQEYCKNQRINFIEGMNRAIGVTEEMATKIEELSKKFLKFKFTPFGPEAINEWDAFHAATSETLADIINQTDMSVESFDTFAIRTREILSDFDRRVMTAAETTAALGNAFTALISKAKDLGTEGSASLIAMFEDLENRGMRVAEVEAYIAEQLGAGLAGYEKMKAAMLESTAAQEAFGNVNIQVYEEMIAYNAKIAANKGITDAIAGATQALIGLSNTTKLTEDQYDQFEQSAATAYKKLGEQGFTEKEALQQLAPMLARLKFLHEQYGLTLDAETMRLLGLAEANGVNTDQAMTQAEANKKICDSLEKLVEFLTGASKAADDLSGSMDRAVRDRSANITFNKIGDIEGGGWMGGQNIPRTPEIYAASGFYSPRLSQDTLIQAHRGEQVNITPAAQNNGGGRTTNLNITIVGPGVTPEAVADAARTAYNNNTHGFRSLMEN